MVAKIESGKSLIGALNYNERKVKAGKAKLIAAQLYGKDAPKLTFDEKLFRLTDLADRNQRTKTNTLHLSLNFDLSENLEKDMLCKIAENYMDRIGFGNQPCLVYQHFDAGHNHIHILTTNITAAGDRISLHNIGKLKSEPARKAIELEYGLVKAEQQQKNEATQKSIKPLVYGKTDTKRTITNIVNYVANAYKFTSLPEFNAVLASYNVLADRGPIQTVMFNNGGLRYWALSENGIKTGVPIKASSIYKKPTLKLLEERIKLNKFLRKPFKAGLANALNMALKNANSYEMFKAILETNKIKLIIRSNDEGRVYGLTYIDEKNKVVFNGSDLGKQYSAAAVEEKLLQNQKAPQLIEPNTTHHQPVFGDTEPLSVSYNNLLSELLSPTEQNGEQNLFERKKKKKKRRLKL